MSMVKSDSRADNILLIYLIILVLFGLAALMSASAPLGYAKFNDSYFYVKRQILNGLLPGLILFLAAAKIPYRLLARFGWFIYAGSIMLLLLVFIPGVGLVINHSHSWVHFGSLLSFQPAEFAKLAVIIMLAKLITDKQHDWSDWQGSLLPVLAVIAPALVLILLQPDIGTLSILVITIFVILYVARIPARYLVFLGLAGIVCFVGLVIAAPYRTERLTTFLHPELDPGGKGYQVNQAFLAVGSGGVWGLGWGQSRQKFQYLPEVNADSIFAVVAEENGFIISVGLVVLIVLLSVRGLKIAKLAPDEFGYLLVAGIMVWFIWQSFLNIGAMVGALPLTGVPLPFVSHGGSALMAMLAAMGVVVNVSKHVTLENK